MGLTKNEILFVFAAIIVVVLYVVYTQKEKEKGTESLENVVNNSNQTSNMVNSVIIEEDTTLQKSDSDELLLRKMTSKNSATGDSYKTVNYAEGDRNGSLSNLDAFFEQGNPLNGNENDNFMPSEDNKNYSLNIYRTNQAAPYMGRPRRELSDEEKFNASELLPKEERQDWFEDVTPQKIKNRHLINIYRPIGVNTVITSRKNPSLDLRGNPVNPKTFVSPFLNSSIEPDVNARGICI